MTIGTFYHPPNVDSVRWMAGEVWPLIRAQLPAAEMRVYGAYPTEAVKQLHRPEHGFHVVGFAPTVEGAMAGPGPGVGRELYVCFFTQSATEPELNVSSSSSSFYIPLLTVCS
jgi:hypothetical protein